MKPGNEPLTVRVTRDGVLRIEIGVECLAHAARWGLALRTDTPEQHVTITDARGFADDVIAELMDEAKNGSTLVTRMIDAACEQAVNNGSEHVETGEEPEKETI